MKTRFSRLCALTGGVALACCAVGFAQDEPQTGNAKPMFAVLPPRITGIGVKPPSSLTTWNGSFTYNSNNYTYNMVGNAPSTNTSTTIPAVIIPIKIVITTRTGKKTTFDPSHVLSNGRTVINNTVLSPLFDSSTTYIQGGVNVGTTQYIDAFQRANFWGIVKTNSNYHLLLGAPTVLAEQTLSPSSRYGRTGAPFGQTVAEVDINWFDSQVQSLLVSLKIAANTVPIFLTYDTYLTQGGCCIGGYHSAVTNSNGDQAYMEATYVDRSGNFSQDVSALSHELGEWADDPLVANPNGNQTPCGILEVGDPLEGEANYGGYPYTVNGFTYNLQDLVLLPYFGAPTSTSVNGWLSFQGNSSLSVCSNGS